MGALKLDRGLVAIVLLVGYSQSVWLGVLRDCRAAAEQWQGDARASTELNNCVA